MSCIIIVEGKNDRTKLRQFVSDEIQIICTYGTLNTKKMERIKKQVSDQEVYIFTDNDASGKRIRAALFDLFPDAYPIYTRRGYAGVEGTPDEYMIQQLEKAGLKDYILYPESLYPIKSISINRSRSSPSQY